MYFYCEMVDKGYHTYRYEGASLNLFGFQGARPPVSLNEIQLNNKIGQM